MSLDRGVMGAGVLKSAPEWTYVLSALVFIALLLLVGVAINWWIAVIVFGPALGLHVFGFVRRAQIRRSRAFGES
jgi:hypothetical protein